MSNIVHLPVTELMTPHLVTCTPYTSLAEIHEAFQKNGIRRVPVIDRSGKLVGIVARSDLLAAEPPFMDKHASGEAVHEALSRVVAETVMTRNPRWCASGSCCTRTRSNCRRVIS